MLNRSRFFNLLALLLLAAFCFGLVRLLVLRYATGDVFPAYSTLRTDPLGAKIFFESLRALPDRVVTRNERDVEKIDDPAHTTLFIAGTREIYFSGKEKTAVEQFVHDGGRLVVTFFPSYQERHRRPRSTSPSPSASPTATPRVIALRELLAKWDVKLKYDRDEKDNIAQRRFVSALEEKLPWHSGISFVRRHPQWRAVYLCKRGPVIIERNFDAGSVVLASDSYFLSNEALLADRAPELLAWLSGPRSRIIFDETHLGVHEQPGVMNLLRRYGLGGFVAGLVVLIILWLWRNATWSLSLRRSAPRNDAIISGRESFAGFVNLLRRGIAPNELLKVCFREWKRPAPHSATSELEAVALNDQGNPVAAYNRITEILHSRKWKTKSAT